MNVGIRYENILQLTDNLTQNRLCRNDKNKKNLIVLSLKFLSYAVGIAGGY